MALATTELNPGAGGSKVLHDTLTTADGAAAPSGAVAQMVKAGHGEAGDFKSVSEAAPMPVQVLGELVEAIEAMRMALNSLTRTIGMATFDVSGQQRVTAAVSSLPTLSTVTTVGTVSNQTNLGGLAANPQVPALMQMSAGDLRSNITVS